MKIWKERLIALVVLTSAFGFLGCAMHVYGSQEPSAELVKPAVETRYLKLDDPIIQHLVLRYDVVKIVRIDAEPTPVVDERKRLHVICEIRVFHKDLTVYRQIPFDVAVDSSYDIDVGNGIFNAYNSCRDRSIEILLEWRKFNRLKTANTVSAKQ